MGVRGFSLPPMTPLQSKMISPHPALRAALSRLRERAKIEHHIDRAIRSFMISLVPP